MSILFSSPSHLQPSHVHDPCTSQRLPAVVSIAYSPESAYFLLSKTHTICECGQNTAFLGYLGASRLLGLRGYLWRLSVVSGLKYGLSSIVAGCSICSGVVVASVRLHLSGLHRRGSIKQGRRWLSLSVALRVGAWWLHRGGCCRSCWLHLSGCRWGLLASCL